MAEEYTKNMIRKVFMYRLNERPFHKITVSNIAKDCKINRNTFYYHYQDIYGVLVEIFEEQFQIVVEEYNDTNSWEDSLWLASKFILENKKAIDHIYNSLYREELEKYIYEASGNIMMRYVEQKSADVPACFDDKKLIASFYQCALTEMVTRWIMGGMQEDPNVIIPRIGALFNGNIESSLQRSKDLDNIWVKEEIKSLLK